MLVSTGAIYNQKIIMVSTLSVLMAKYPEYTDTGISFNAIDVFTNSIRSFCRSIVLKTEASKNKIKNKSARCNSS